MGMRENILKNILQHAGYQIVFNRLPYPKKNLLGVSDICFEIMRVYQNLGGVLSEVPLNLRRWDIEAGDTAIELDEELHFNRYRNLTLRSPLYKKLPHFPLKQYRNYCIVYEKACLNAGSYGKKWTNDSCEKQYGRAGKAGQLTGNGSPRWRQRAFYDFVKDMAPLLCNISVIRISIYDSLRINGTEYLIRRCFK